MKKKKLLILGASGFIGKNLAIFFSKKKDFQVTGTYFHKKTFIKNVKVVQCNLTKKKEILKKMVRPGEKNEKGKFGLSQKKAPISQNIYPQR